jgi:putative addiction module CopG family antidote
MEVTLTPSQEAFIRQGIEAGRYRTVNEAIGEALALWESRERNRLELLSALDEAEADLASGAYTEFTDATIPQLAAELKREARQFRRDKRD